MLILLIGYKFFSVENTDRLSNEKKFHRKASEPIATNLSATWEGEDPFKSKESNKTGEVGVAKKAKMPMLSQIDSNTSVQKKKSLVKTKILTKDTKNLPKKVSMNSTSGNIEGGEAVTYSEVLERREQEKELFKFNKSNLDKQPHHISKDEESELLNENLREFKQH